MKPVRTVHSPIISAALSNVSPEESRRIGDRMRLAVVIGQILNDKGMSQKTLAQRMNKRESEVSEWLSGDRNFTIDTLSDIGAALGVNFFGVPRTASRIPVGPLVVKRPKSGGFPAAFLPHYAYDFIPADAAISL